MNTMVYDAKHRISELRRSLRKQLRQQHALADSGVIRKEGYHGGELCALEVACDMLLDVHGKRRRYAKATLQTVLQALEQEYQRMSQLAGEMRGPWFVGFSAIWRRVVKVIESLPEEGSSQTENLGSLTENCATG